MKNFIPAAGVASPPAPGCAGHALHPALEQAGHAAGAPQHAELQSHRYAQCRQTGLGLPEVHHPPDVLLPEPGHQDQGQDRLWLHRLGEVGDGLSQGSGAAGKLDRIFEKSKEMVKYSGVEERPYS